MNEGPNNSKTTTLYNESTSSFIIHLSGFHEKYLFASIHFMDLK